MPRLRGYDELASFYPNYHAGQSMAVGLIIVILSLLEVLLFLLILQVLPRQTDITSEDYLNQFRTCVNLSHNHNNNTDD